MPAYFDLNRIDKGSERRIDVIRQLHTFDELKLRDYMWVVGITFMDEIPSIQGIFEPKAFVDIPDEDWTRMFEVNVMSGVRLTRHYLKGMLDRKAWGRVVFVSSAP